MNLDEATVTAVKEILPAVGGMGAGTGVFILIAIMAWKDSWPWKNTKRKAGSPE